MFLFVLSGQEDHRYDQDRQPTSSRTTFITHLTYLTSSLISLSVYFLFSSSPISGSIFLPSMLSAITLYFPHHPFLVVTFLVSTLPFTASYLYLLFISIIFILIIPHLPDSLLWTLLCNFPRGSTFPHLISFCISSLSFIFHTFYSSLLPFPFTFRFFHHSLPFFRFSTPDSRGGEKADQKECKQNQGDGESHTENSETEEEKEGDENRRNIHNIHTLGSMFTKIFRVPCLTLQFHPSLCQGHVTSLVSSSFHLT